MMLVAITTVTAIALAHAVSRPPASKDVGWGLQTQMTFEAADPTDQQILLTGQYSAATSLPDYTLAAVPIDRIEWLKAELASFGAVEDGWDGDGSVAPASQHIAAAMRLLDILPAGIPLPKVMLSNDGEIGLYWKTDSYLADAVIEDEQNFSLFIRSLKAGNAETFVPSIAIRPEASTIMSEAFLAV